MASNELSVTNLPDTRRQEMRKPDHVNVGDAERVLSAVGGGALVVYGLARGKPAGIALALLGGALIYRGVTGHCHTYAALGMDTSDQGPAVLGALNQPTYVEKAVTINRSAEDLYRYWRNFENLPRFMKHLESVSRLNDTQSHWVAKAPAGSTVDWDAEITDDRPNELIAWRSLAGADVYNAGVVRFAHAPGGRGAEVHVRLEYAPPGGVIGTIAAKLFGEEPGQQIEGDLRRFKQMMEAGEIATIDGQPTGRRSALGRLISQENATPGLNVDSYDQRQTPPAQERAETNDVAPAGQAPKKPLVQKASEDSFPASDPPAWTTGGDEEREVGV